VLHYTAHASVGGKIAQIGSRLVDMAAQKMATEFFTTFNASSGSGTSIHMSAEMFKHLTGVNIVHVPYKGSAPAVTDLLGGQVQMMFDNIPSALPHIKAGKLRPLATTGARARPAAARRADGCRSRRARLRDGRVVRPGRAGRHAQGRDRPAERKPRSRAPSRPSSSSA
jgi:hypothetical protein